MNNAENNSEYCDINWDKEFEYCKKLYADIMEKEEKDCQDIGLALLIIDMTMHQFIRNQVNADEVVILKGLY